MTVPLAMDVEVISESEALDIHGLTSDSKGPWSRQARGNYCGPHMASKVHSGTHLVLQVSQCGGLRRELVTHPTPTHLDWPPAW